MKPYKIVTGFLVIATAIASLCAVDAQSYQTITTVTGSNGQTTDYFYIPATQWRITWSYVPDPAYPDYAVFSVFIYPKGETTMFTETMTKVGANETSGVTYIGEGQKDYYIQVICANLNKYTITVEAQVSPTPSIPEFSLSAFALITMVLVVTATLVISKRKHHLNQQ
ncbi:MAG: hypothetical protein NWE92_02310 [Candidatus Bathyarchaeota archaeon]|nr:hypothetical protein [Candidatus Bathyarchaeota archaeon]